MQLWDLNLCKWYPEVAAKVLSLSFTTVALKLRLKICVLCTFPVQDSASKLIFNLMFRGLAIVINHVVTVERYLIPHPYALFRLFP